jgi:hypothetical protein
VGGAIKANWRQMDRESLRIDQNKIEYGYRFDGKWVLMSHTSLTAEEVAVKCGVDMARQ